MATSNKDFMQDLESHRLRLEENVSKLRKSLQHWQTWEAEYEGLKEEILGSKSTGSRKDLEAVGEDFGGTLVTRKEIKELYEDKKGTARSSKQIIDLLSKRIDYVQQNVKTIQKQLNTAEEKLDTLFVLQQPEVPHEKGLPVTEIREELDEHGNIISSTTSLPEEVSSQVVEALKKAGVKELTSMEGGKEHENIEIAASSDTIPQSLTGKELSKDNITNVTQDLPVRTKSTEPILKPAKSKIVEKAEKKGARKSVTFAEDTKEEPLVPSKQSMLGVKGSPFYSYGQLAPQDEKEDLSTAIIPDDDSLEDAVLRKEMLRYGLSEVGAVVAELELDETGSDASDFDDEYDEEGEEESSSIEDDEDEFGRSTQRVLTDSYRRQMQELEMKLNARAMENVGPKPDLGSGSVDDISNDVKQVVVTVDDADRSSSGSSNGSAKKQVRFASELDISSAPDRAKESPSPVTEGVSASPAVHDAVIERQIHTAEPNSAAPTPQRKISRFKSSRSKLNANPSKDPKPVTPDFQDQRPNTSVQRHTPLSKPSPSDSSPNPSISSPEYNPATLPTSASTNQPTPSDPPGNPLSNTIIERPSLPSNPTPPDPDDLDPALLHQQVATEYHRLRNRMIQRKGGFKSREDEETVPLSEEEGGPAKKISRFKAAKLGIDVN